MHHQNRHGDLLQVFGEVRLGKGHVLCAGRDLPATNLKSNCKLRDKIDTKSGIWINAS
jgi:hypothetical protein